jgi:hypothetical protein
MEEVSVIFGDIADLDILNDQIFIWIEQEEQPEPDNPWYAYAQQ